MKKFKIVKDTNPNLRLKCDPVEMPLSKEDEETLLDMIEYLKLSQDDEYASKHHIRSGVGLAAPQIGLRKRMFAVYVNDGRKVHEYGLVNPKIIEESARLACLEGGEGCLSVDKDHPGYVHRHYKIRLTAYDVVTKKDIDIVATGYFAIVLQHEYDHLDGKLYYDRIDIFQPNVLKPNETKI